MTTTREPIKLSLIKPILQEFHEDKENLVRKTLGIAAKMPDPLLNIDMIHEYLFLYFYQLITEDHSHNAEETIEVFLKQAERFVSKKIISTKDTLTLSHLCLYAMTHYSFYDSTIKCQSIPMATTYDYDEESNQLFYGEALAKAKIQYWKTILDHLLDLESKQDQTSSDNPDPLSHYVVILVELALKEKRNTRNVVETFLFVFWRKCVLNIDFKAEYENYLNQLANHIQTMEFDLSNMATFSALISVLNVLIDTNKISLSFLNEFIEDLINMDSKKDANLRDNQKQFCMKLAEQCCLNSQYNLAMHYFDMLSQYNVEKQSHNLPQLVQRGLLKTEIESKSLSTLDRKNAEANFEKLINELGKMPQKEIDFENALAGFYNFFLTTNLLQISSSSLNDFRKHILLSKVKMPEHKVAYAAGAGLLATIAESKESKQTIEDHFAFGYLSTGIEPLLPCIDKRQVFIFDDQVLKRKECIVRREDLVVFSKSMVLDSYVFGRVHYIKQTQKKKSHSSLITRVTAPNGEVKEYISNPLDLISTGSQAHNMVLLDTLEMLHQIHAADYQSAYDMVKIFNNLAPENKSMLPGVLREKREKQAKYLTNLCRRYEVSIMGELEFKEFKPDAEKSASFKSGYKSGMFSKGSRPFLKEVQITDTTYIKKLFELIESKEPRSLSKIRTLVFSEESASTSVQRIRTELVNSKWNETTPLIYAVKLSKIEIVKLLLELGARINDREQDISPNFGRAYGSDALMTAVELGNLEMIKVLIARGANLGALKHPTPDFTYNENALSIAMKKIHLPDFYRIAEFLIENGARHVDGRIPKPLAAFRPFLVINGHGGQIKDNKFESSQTIITPGKLSEAYIFAPDSKEHLEINLLMRGTLKPLLKKQGNSLQSVEWQKYEAKTVIPDVYLSPWKQNELHSFAERISSKGLWSKIDNNSDYYTLRDKSSFLVTIKNEEFRCLDNTASHLFFLECITNPIAVTNELPLFFCAPLVGKVKLLNPVTLGVVLFCIAYYMKETRPVVLATCNDGPGAYHIIQDEKPTNPVRVLDILHPPQLVVATSPQSPPPPAMRQTSAGHFLPGLIDISSAGGDKKSEGGACKATLFAKPSSQPGDATQNLPTDTAYQLGFVTQNSKST